MEPFEIPVNRFPKPSWVATRAMLGLAYASVSLAVFLLVPMQYQGFGYTEPVVMFGLPSGTIFALISSVFALTGTIWMRRILKAGSEPESIDRHWWSRA